MNKAPAVRGIYGRALDRAMTSRGVTNSALAKTLKADRATIRRWRLGRSLPNASVAVRVHEILDDDKLVLAFRADRRRKCPECAKTFYVDQENGRATRATYCTDRCAANHLQREGRARRNGYARAATVRRRFMLEDERDQLKEAVREVCEACEHDGICKDATCPIQRRGQSPFQLIQLQRRTA